MFSPSGRAPWVYGIVRLLAFALACSPFSAGVKILAAQGPEGTLSNPAALLVDPLSHTVYAVDTDHNTVIIFDETSNRRTLVPVAHAPVSLGLDPALHRLYVGCAGAGVVQVLSTTSRQVVATMPTDHHPYAIAVDPVRHQVFVTNTFSNLVNLIDGNTNTVRSLSLGSQDTALVDSAHGRVYFTSYENTTITEYDEASGSVRHLPAAVHLWALAGDWSHRLLFAVVIGGDKVLALPLTAGTASPLSRSTPAMPDAVLVTPAGQLITANYAADSLAIFASSNGATFASIPTGSHPVGMALVAPRNTIYIANSHSSTVTAVDLTGHKAPRTLVTGTHPFAIACDPTLGRVYTANHSGDPLTEVVADAQ